MLPELRVDGADSLRRLNRTLAQASPRLRRELAKAIRTGTEPAKKAAIDNIEPTLPTSGGLAGLVQADTRIVARRRGSSARPGLRLQAQSRRNVRRMDRGRVRKPLFGNTDHWYTQKIPEGWFTKPMVANATHVRRTLMAALDEFGRHISRSV